MVNMFSGNTDKKVPQNLKECYQTDNVTKNLWTWCERLEKLGEILFWLLICFGIFDTISAAIEADKFIKEIGADTVEEIRKLSAEIGMEIPTVTEVLFENLIMWSLYAFLEYCAYHVIALLVGSLASIVQHNRITANVALYNCAKEEPAQCDNDSLNNANQGALNYFKNDGKDDVDEETLERFLKEEKKEKIRTYILYGIMVFIFLLLAIAIIKINTHQN